MADSEQQKTQATSGLWLGRIGVPFCVLMSVAFLGVSASQLFELAQMKRWPKTECLITGAMVKSETRRTRRTGAFKVYWPMVRFQYKVDGRLREGYHVAPFKAYESTNEAAVKKVAAKFTTGQKKDAYYDPKSKMAYLEIRMGRETKAMLFLCLLCIVGALFFRFLYRSSKEKMEALEQDQVA